ncbi:MAG: aminodeoxychorismate/anthranilate synthase component II [Gemmatimonadetes bacterium]|nr:aminodeoxychorismate/anthranilate synthase component II [Gemmatimonadota bacterium]
MVLLLDNYDSFAYNLARFLEELGETVVVRRNDDTSVAEIGALAPSHIVISPGPCTPAEAGVSLEVVETLGETVPILGVCLGHQCIASASGGRVVRANRPMHGRLAEIEHDETGLFAGLGSPLRVTRYHSLVVDPEAPGEGVVVTAWSEDGEAMALGHASSPLWGVQFHPEAVMTFGGHRLLANFLALGRGEEPASVSLDAEVCPDIR